MSEMSKSSVLQSRIITTLKLIEATQEAKKVQAKSYTDQIKTMKSELDSLLKDLEDAQREELEDEADEILETGKELINTLAK